MQWMLGCLQNDGENQSYSAVYLGFPVQKHARETLDWSSLVRILVFVFLILLKTPSFSPLLLAFVLVEPNRVWSAGLAPSILLFTSMIERLQGELRVGLAHAQTFTVGPFALGTGQAPSSSAWLHQLHPPLFPWSHLNGLPHALPISLSPTIVLVPSIPGSSVSWSAS